ncbi:MAG: carboxypeptidase regulatory-like domain-containing protein [Planctomycetota bacterium]
MAARLWAALSLVAAAAVGCGAAMHPGDGVVRFEDGEPVRAGGVELRALDGGAQYAGRIGREGGFTLSSLEGKPGVPMGEYEAVVVLVVVTEHLAAHKHVHGRDVPKRYFSYDTSDLRVDVPSTDAGPIELEIQSE